ncbi:MAG TPA: pyridoxamine 5'-phosphate oxidase family protein [Candidatus Saccharimonadales bacterium]|nr:pyridoxamine 5'-phosphate oxidase family protein [Candidatus Saccharimonadales bacterium]
MDTVQPNEKAKAILDSVRFITVATVSAQGEPWNTPVTAFRFKGSDALYWASWRETQHSQNIRANGRAFIVAFDSTPANGKVGHAVYIEATATELTDESEVLQAALVFEGDKYKMSDGSQYLGEHPLRMYKAVPNKIWINGDMHVGGFFVDVRVEAEA